VGVAVRISVALLVALTGAAYAESLDAEIIGHQGPAFASIDLRTALLDQSGHGFQSQDGPRPGGESMLIFQPSVLMTIVQSERVTHQITLPLDFITAASPDAVDATTQASRRNIAGDFDVRTKIKLDDSNTLSTRAAVHAEEWIGGGIVGVGWKRSLADDNATVSINGTFGLDVFDDHDHFGTFLGKTKRTTSSVNVGVSQLLSPTTVIDGSYGATYQRGTLRTGWNAVPLEDGKLEDEVFPRSRLRQSVSVRVSQHVPVTHSTAKLRYRGYVDDFGLHAHAIEASVYQYIVNWLYVRGSYRYYTQNGVDFFTTSLPLGFDDSTFRTSDSDLAPLSSNEFTVSLSTVKGRGPLDKWSASAELFRYQRSNDLQITAFALTVGRAL
jgi:Protein of unknown function (DUF3570)